MTMTLLIIIVCVTDNHIYFPFVVITCRSFPHSWLIAGFVTIVTRLVPLVEQELSTLQGPPSSPQIFSGVCVAQSFIFCV